MPPKLKTKSTQRNGATAPPKGNPSFGKSRSARRRAKQRAASALPYSIPPALRSGGFNRVNAASVFGDRAAYKSTSGEIPAAFVNIDSNSTFCDSLGAVVHPYTGTEGVAFVGCQPFSTISMTNTASDSGVFTTGTLATVSSDGSFSTALINLSPDDLNGRIAAISNLYTQFVFRDVIIEYISNCATTQADSFAMAYTRDPGVNAATTFSSARSIQPSITIPFRTDRAYFHFHYPGQEIFYALRDTGSAAGLRLTHQGSILAYADKAQGNVASLGYTNIWYVIELYNPISSQGITFMSLSDDERRVILQMRRTVGMDWEERTDHCDDIDQKERPVSRSIGMPNLTQLLRRTN